MAITGSPWGPGGVLNPTFGSGPVNTTGYGSNWNEAVQANPVYGIGGNMWDPTRQAWQAGPRGSWVRQGNLSSGNFAGTGLGVPPAGGNPWANWSNSALAGMQGGYGNAARNWGFGNQQWPIQPTQWQGMMPQYGGSQNVRKPDWDWTLNQQNLARKPANTRPPIR